MAWTDRYANFDLATGANDGTSAGDAWQTPAAVIAAVAAGQRVNIKRQAAGYNLTTSVTFNVNGTATAPIWYRCYATTPGDGGFWECEYNSGGVAALAFTGNYCIVEGVHFKPGATTNSNSFTVNGINSWSIRNKIVARGSVSIANMMRNWISIEYSGTGSVVVSGTNSYSSVFLDSYMKRIGSTSSAQLIIRDTFGVPFVVQGCTLVGAGNASEDGIFLDRHNDARGTFLLANRLYNFRHGIYLDETPNAGSETFYAMRNLFDTMGGYAVYRNATEAGFVNLMNNYYRACTSGFTNYSVEAEIDGSNLPLSADPFEDKASNDFSMNDAAGGGQDVRDAEIFMDPTASSGMKFNPWASWWDAVTVGTPAFASLG